MNKGCETIRVFIIKSIAVTSSGSPGPRKYPLSGQFCSLVGSSLRVVSSLKG